MKLLHRPLFGDLGVGVGAGPLSTTPTPRRCGYGTRLNLQGLAFVGEVMISIARGLSNTKHQHVASTSCLCDILSDTGKYTD